ncbi:NACHT, LRR and PYD domains-containing protein 3-like isoform X4 [Pygocentrus nattereri]|uniref:B30.2/SPRY domain-containing protein n=1 Tax=Pygocentrus nattereri TaxID=42514 RepID=A0AAR2LKR4_PYGNA|nr:NACHT, LRR and PYD domains-containing protein 3-like isoform X4 [Pygocentrus nattereri]
MMDPHSSSSGGGTSDPKVKRAGSPEPSSSSVKRRRSTSDPDSFSSDGGASDPGLQTERAGSPMSSSVSMKSDQSMGVPFQFSRGAEEPSSVSMKSDQSMRVPFQFSRGAEEPSSVSMKSDQSMGVPFQFSRGAEEPSSVSMKSDQSMRVPFQFSRGAEEPSSVSMKSDQSMGVPFQFSRGAEEPSSVSMKSDQSMRVPFQFSRGAEEPSSVSMKSDQSMGVPFQFSSSPDSTEAALQTLTHTLSTGTGELQQDSYQPVGDVLQTVLEKHKTSQKSKYESLFEGLKTQENKTLLNRIYTQLYIVEGESEGVNEEHEVLQVMKTSRKHLQDTPINCVDIFKPLQGPNEKTEEKDIKTKVFKHKEKQKERKRERRTEVPNLRAVLTKGIAGIGKTVSVQKFILDWAEGKANQDVDFMFVLPFRELNLIKDDQYSLHELLCDFHPELKDLDPEIYDQLKAVFIFDGLDESRIPLDFEQSEKISDITMTSSVGVLMTNLINGELLPSDLIWITSRPAAANQIPPKYIDRVTEIQGFNDPQKEEYFRKKISDQDQANKIISHIKAARSLHVMCHIPVFCWISATVLQKIIKQHNTKIPKTLTEMYSHFLITQTNVKNEKYEEKDERDPKNLLESNRTVLLKLAELAFKQLMKGNVMFYEEDLRESSIDVTEASVYSGIFTEIFREECVLHQRKVYCFVHLSFQEFLAAVFVHHCYESKNMEILMYIRPQHSELSENVSLDDLLEGAVDKALESENGHLDLFLRFLLGISVESNQRLLQGLLKHTRSSSENFSKTTQFIKQQIERGHLPINRSINLFLCLCEMNDQSLCKDIKKRLSSDESSEKNLTPAQCSALACILLISKEVMDELDLKKYCTSEEGYKRLFPAVNVHKKARLAGCDLTKNSCEALCSALQSVNSALRDLDLSNNDLQDSGVELLSAALKTSHCKLEILRLAGCHLTKNSCEALCSALQSVNSALRDLDLSNNDLQDSGVELLSAALKTSHCKLEILRLAGCDLTKNSCEALCSALQSVNSALRDLDLSNNDLQDSGVELLSAALKTSHCKLEILRLAGCHLTKNSCEALCSALQSVNSALRDLDLSNNDLQDSGVELLSAALKTSHCKLEILRLSGCMVTDQGCISLASALKSNPSHLRELDLTYNHPGESGVKLLSDLLEDLHCTLDTLRMDCGGEIRIKPGLKKYPCDLTLDPDTAHAHLSLSEGNRRVENVGEEQPYPDHPGRFEHQPQVLCRESLTGRCYWEAEWTGQGAVISVLYRGIQRKGDGLFGTNEESWSLNCCNNSYSVCHNNTRTVVPDPPSSSTAVGVYVDWPAGALSFYSVSLDTQTLTHLYTFNTKFTEPLCAGLWVGEHSSVRLRGIE